MSELLQELGGGTGVREPELPEIGQMLAKPQSEKSHTPGNKMLATTALCHGEFAAALYWLSRGNMVDAVGSQARAAVAAAMPRLRKIKHRRQTIASRESKVNTKGYQVDNGNCNQ